jgi:hypothetical protein
MHHNHHKRKVAWFLWPFVALWNLLAFILGLTSRLVLGVLGLALMIIGFILTITLIAAPVGIPFLIIGLLMIFRSLF